VELNGQLVKRVGLTAIGLAQGASSSDVRRSCWHRDVACARARRAAGQVLASSAAPSELVAVREASLIREERETGYDFVVDW
jgi:hypothetical protein